MSKDLAIKVESISKMYDLGQVGTGTLSKDLNRTFAKLRGRPDPYTTIAEINDRTQKSKSNTIWALKDINFEVERGDVLGIIGRNGAGKSTLLKILSQITAPTTGTIKTKGRLASLLEVGTGMHPEMSARDNIFLNGAIMGMTRTEVKRKLDDIVDFAGITKYIDTPIKRFSSGMQVRLGFAVAAFLEPEILVVDEVLAVGDAEFQKRAIGKMKEVSQGGDRTVLFVSHNMRSIRKLCPNVLLMNLGGVHSIKSAEESIAEYLNLNNKQYSINVNEEKGANRTAKLIAIELNNNATSLANDMDLNFCLSLDITDDRNYIIGFYIRDGIGDVIFYSETLDTQIVVNGNTKELMLNVPKGFLMANSYTATVGIKTTNNEVIKVYKDLIQFELENLIDHRAQRPGKVFLPTTWIKK